MAFIVPTRRGGFEIRESGSTPKGPRSRTLASFRELSDEALRDAARRAGAPSAWEPVDRAGRELIAELGKGRHLDPTLRHLLLDLLGGDGGDGVSLPAGDGARAVAEWMAS